MDLDSIQRKIAESKPTTYQIVKGVECSGKTTAVVHRALYLKNNYCMYDKDRILIIIDKNKKSDFKKKLNNVENNSFDNYLTLFSNNKETIHIKSMIDLITEHYNEYRKNNKLKVNIIDSDDQKETIIEKCLLEIKKEFPRLKTLSNWDVSFFVSEISWIKTYDFKSLDEYQNVDRKGRGKRLSKNSSIREAIYKASLLYNKRLKELNLIDSEDMANIAIKYAKDNIKEKYSHIIVDEFDNLTKSHFEYINTLCNNETYSNILFVLNKSKLNRCNAWITKSGKPKIFSLNKSYVNKLESVMQEEVTKVYEKQYSIESFEYFDIRYGIKHKFYRDSDKTAEIIINHESEDEIVDNSELVELQLYSNIAAGEPILINDGMEDSFYLPKYWVRGVKDCFMLKVKGDSMIGANIDDGDIIVIRKQSIAQNNDIVAVELDGSATLKRLNISKAGLALMPENDKYSPIYINDGHANIIGLAIGIIKHRQ